MYEYKIFQHQVVMVVTTSVQKVLLLTQKIKTASRLL